MGNLLNKISANKGFAVAGLMLVGSLFAVAHAAEDIGLGGIANNIKGNLGAVEQLIIALCYIGGIAFAGAAIMKFKQYKDNPQSGTLGQPIALIFIAAALVWLPQIIKTSGETVFGGTGGAGSATEDVQVLE